MGSITSLENLLTEEAQKKISTPAAKEENEITVSKPLTDYFYTSGLWELFSGRKKKNENKNI